MTRKIFKGIGYLAALLLVFAGTARAQMIWRTVHTSFIPAAGAAHDSTFRFTAVSFSGNVGTASAVVSYDDSEKRIAIFRSEDFGKTWVEQLDSLKLNVLFTNAGITKLKQLDAENAVGILEQGAIARTSDGGASWHIHPAPANARLYDMDFSDPSTGIVIAERVDSSIFTTSDGGEHWTYQPVPPVIYHTCVSEGTGRFRLLKFGRGPIYTTNDHFATIDSTGLIIDSTTQAHPTRFVITACSFIGTDTIYAFGRHSPVDTAGYYTRSGLIMRSTDAGRHWGAPYIVPDSQILSIDFMTTPYLDTLYAAGTSNLNLARSYSNFLMSTDNGSSWQLTQFVLDTEFSTKKCFALTLAGDGHPIAALGDVDGFSLEGVLVRGEAAAASVEVAAKTIAYYTTISPNPATNFFEVRSIDRSPDPLHLYNIFGAEVASGRLSAEGLARIDTRSLPNGVYAVVLDHLGSRFSIGKVVVQ